MGLLPASFEESFSPDFFPIFLRFSEILCANPCNSKTFELIRGVGIRTEWVGSGTETSFFAGKKRDEFTTKSHYFLLSVGVERSRITNSNHFVAGPKCQKYQGKLQKAERKEKEKRHRERLRSIEMQRNQMHRNAW